MTTSRNQQINDIIKSAGGIVYDIGLMLEITEALAKLMDKEENK